MTVTLIGIFVLLVLLFGGAPLGLAMTAVGFAGYGLLRGWEPALAMASQQILDLAMNFGFSVLPLFILMGVFVARSGMSEDLYEACYKWLGHFRGGLALATVAACGGFAAVSGSSLATAATMAKVAVPAMRKYKYTDSFAIGTVAAGGTLGMLIPPSTAMIIYGILTEVDVAKLFIGGVLPGLLTIFVYFGVISVVVRVFPKAGPRGEHSSWRDRFVSLSKVWGVIVLFFIIMGGIFLGVFTPSEAGGIGAAGALAFAIGRRKMSWWHFFASLVEAARITSLIMIVGFGALILNQFVNVAGLPAAMAEFIQGLNVSLAETLLFILLIYVLLGTIIEGLAIIFLTVPIFVPIIESLGFDLIWFGVLMIMIIEISLITPPIGLNVFVMKSMLPEVPLGDIFKGIGPFFVGDIIRLLIVAFFPPLVLYLPSLMR
ncbi:MAG: TRAP transporter large permease [Rhodospirillales bacterium]|jgi:tripartite ATP-independent transporter DctM subunit|nr:TRAP transporter large permease [Rhodospirillales bacterium]MDP6642775.1 TRAP transporter large permease [Rhodospirillales bacterium]